MQNQPLFGGFFDKKPPQNNQQDSQRKSRYNQLLMIFVIGGVILYPFFIVGAIPLIIVRHLDKEDKANNVHDLDYQSFLKRWNPLFMGLSIVLMIVNIALFILVIPRGYFSCYLLFPFNLFKNSLQFNYQTILALLFGGLGMGSIEIAYAGFVDKRRVVSKEAQQLQILQSKAYAKRKENKFVESQKYTEEYNNEYHMVYIMKDIALRNERLEALAKVLLIGTDEYGFSFIMAFDELNQHALIPATTGSGKTTLLQIFVEHAAKFNIPVLLIDGKGAEETLESMEEIAGYYGKKIHAFSDTKDMRYNPVKNGNDISIRDKLTNLAQTESVYYSLASKALLQVTVQLLDEFEGENGIKRSLPYLQKYLLPRNVLNLFSSRLIQRVPTLFDYYEPITTEKKKQKKKLKTDAESSNEDSNDGEKSNKKLKNEGENSKIEYNKITLDPAKLSLEDYYFILRKNRESMSKEEQVLFTRLFIRYEHKDNPFYLYATSEALQTNINMLLDSELGRLFDTKEGHEELDIMTLAEQNAITYVSLNGLIYGEFITTLAQMLIGDVNYYLSELYAKKLKKPFLVIFDEPASYLNNSFIDLVNKGRGAGLYAIFSPQTMADIDALGEKLKEKLVGNVNTFFIGKTNETGEVSYWAETFGTYSDIEVTEMTEQESGYSDAGKTDWTGGRGTKRNVDRFKFNPNRIRELRVGEFVVYRTAKDVHEGPRAVYVRKPSLNQS